MINEDDMRRLEDEGKRAIPIHKIWKARSKKTTSKSKVDESLRRKMEMEVQTFQDGIIENRSSSKVYLSSGP